MKKAFTLAEVLITLGIIGVVAALTMPGLVANYQKLQTVTQLKKAYSVLNQAMKLSEVDNGDYAGWDLPSGAGAERTYIDKYWLPYFNVIKVCSTYSDCGYSSSFPYLDASGASYEFGVVTSGFRVPFVTAEGVSYMFSVACSTINNPCHILWVDLNHSKPPNKYGKDLFQFVRVPNKGILPFCYEKSEAEIDEGCNKTTVGGDCCAAKIIKDGWEIKDDYPW